jgi:hypothetical protein
MDFEHAVSPVGIPQGYAMSQIGDGQIILTVPRPPSTEVADIEISHDPSDNSIYIGIRGQSPAICGVLAEVISAVSPEITNDQIKVTLTKAVPSHLWTSLISDRSSRGIDAKSQWILGMAADASGDFKTAWRHISESAEAGYLHALLLAADAYGGENPFGVLKDLNESFRLLNRAWEQTRLPEIGLRVANTLLELNEFERAKVILEQCAPASPEAKFRLAVLLSPVHGSLNDYEVSTALFRELANAGDARAMRLLVDHVRERDPEEARHWEEEARRAGENHARPEGELSGWQSLVIPLGVVIGIGALGWAIWLLVRKRPNRSQ